MSSGKTKLEDDNQEAGSDLKRIKSVQSTEKICEHICEKKKRRCKFVAARASNYCVEHLVLYSQHEFVEKRIPCPLDPKHSVYEKNLEKHLKKCNSKIRTLGKFDVKDINVTDDAEELIDYPDLQPIIDSEATRSHFAKLNSQIQHTTYKELNDDELKVIIEYLIYLDSVFKLYDLEYDKLDSQFILSQLTESSGQDKIKHMKQISSIVSQVELVMEELEEKQSCCLVELGAGRGKLSLWLEQAWKNKSARKEVKTNFLLVERGSQKLKADSQIKNDLAAGEHITRVRLDLKDLVIGKQELIKTSDRYIMYGKHLCGVATDFSLRCLRKSIQSEDNKFKGFLLAVCCHHKCEYSSMCGRKFLNLLNIDSNLFYVIRSLTSWSTSGGEETILGHNRHRIGKICKNLLDYARIQYLKNGTTMLSDEYTLDTKLFYYVDQDVTLENTMIYASLKKK